MRNLRATLGSLVFLILVPGVVAGVVPWLLTGWNAGDAASPWLEIAGALLLAGGLVVLLDAFRRFAVEGVGTPAPVAPTEHLVLGGAYRYVRNPMYLAVGATIVGQALVFGRPVLLAYATVFGATVWTFVRMYEEPALARRFGAGYEAYRRNVPGWWPRRTPWTGA